MGQEIRTYVAGAKSLIGAAIVRALQRRSAGQIVGLDGEPDLERGAQVEQFFETVRPDLVYLAAGKSGGIAANQVIPAELMLNNLLVASNVISSAHRHGTRKLLYLASSCTYPRDCPQPMREDALLTGPLEPTNEAYAVAKIAGLKLCQAYRQQHGAGFICGIVANSFGPGDDFDLERSHVIGALMRKMHRAKREGAPEVVVWGTGSPRRDFLFADDMGDACLHLMEHYDGLMPVNVTGGVDLSIAQLAELVMEAVGYEGRLVFDSSRPDGMPRKILDHRRLHDLGWRPRHSLKSGLAATYRWFLENVVRDEARERQARP